MTVLDRQPIFRQDRLAQIVINAIRSTAKDFAVPIYAYCVMPDHVHVLVGADFTSARLQEVALPRADVKSAPTSAIEFVKYMKGRSVAAARNVGLTQRSFWQRSFFDHFLRKDEDVETVCRYIWNNPVRAGIVQHAEEYPYNGSTIFESAVITDRGRV